jgi:hypothetical protein
MASAPRWDLLLYVKSVRVIHDVLPAESRDAVYREVSSAGWAEIPPPMGGGFAAPISSSGGRLGREPEIETEIPEDEEAAIRVVWEVAHAKGRRLHLVDVGKESALRRVLEERVRHLREFPVLVRRDHARLEGPGAFTKQNLERFLSE